MAEITQKNSFKTVVYDADRGVSDLDVKSKWTGEVPRVDNRAPENYIKYLVPVSLAPISIKDLPEPFQSSQRLAEAKKIGLSVSSHELKIYNAAKIGQTRRLSNSELIMGSPLFGTPNDDLTFKLANLVSSQDDSRHFVDLITRAAKNKGEALFNDEWEDLRKISVLRTNYFGRHLSLPASPDLIGVEYPRRFMQILEMVVKKYCDITNADLPSRAQAMLMMTDTKETAVGGPTFASAMVDEQGRDYHEKRLYTLADMPVPDYNEDPMVYLVKCYEWGSALGLPDQAMTFSAALSFRQGAKGHTPLPLIYFEGGQFVAKKEALSMDSFQRLVFPASHALNVVLTPAVVQMKMARKRILGMYHTPELMSRWVSKMNKQGKYALESDFSNYDLHISSTILQYVAGLFAKYSAKFKWEFTLLKHFFATTGVIYPSWETLDPNMVTFFKEMVSLLSGTLPTSESGSVIAVSSNLYGFEKAGYKNAVSDWLSGKFILADQSDDVLSTHDVHIDQEAFEAALWDLRLKIKLKEGYVFLKKILPIGSLAHLSAKIPPTGAPLWSRQIQQTFYNETMYEGVPDAIIRLGTLARSTNLDLNPITTSELVSDWKDCLASYPILKPIIPILFDGVLAMSSTDKEEIVKYSASKGGQAWLSQLIARADADPSAAMLLESLEQVGFQLSNYMDTSVSQRKSYLDALYRQPTSMSRSQVLSICKWLGH